MHCLKGKSNPVSMALAALVLLAPGLGAQSAGQADVAFQGYYLREPGSR